MGNWSIIPTDFVDFNQETGKATFLDGSYGTTYTVRYSSDTCSASETFTVGSEPTPPTPPGPTPTDCDVTADSTLDGYVSEFSEALGTTISVDNTPCTYKYLKEAYSVVSNKSDFTIMWMLANVLSELTPEVGKVTSYFEKATTNTGGIVDLIDLETIYSNRMAGGVEYAMWKHNDFSTKNAMAANARTELSAKGISEAKLIYVPNEFIRGEVINPTNIVPNMGGQVTLEQINVSDITAMSDILEQYPDSQAIKESELGDNPFADKEYCSKRLCQILEISSSDDKYNIWLDFIDYAKDADDAAINVIKRGIDGKLPPQYRLRPTGQTIRGKFANMVCGGEAEQAARDLCSDTDTCKSEYDRFIDETGSYPSGHSGRGYIAGLVYLQVKGIDKMDRMSQYCHNRAVVRAHWVSDTIAAKVITSTVIGFLNGVKNYLDKVSVLMGDIPTPPTPTDCVCEGVNSKYNGPNNTCSKNSKNNEYIGSGKTLDSCGETIPMATRVTIEEGDGSATTLESIRVELQEGNVYFIYGNILENTSGAIRKTRIYFNVKEKDSSGEISDESYINIYQAG